MKKREVSITTFDNPFCPITQFDDWLRFDEDKGYYTINYVQRIERNSDDLPESLQDAEHERAIDEIIEYDFRNIYKKVVKFVDCAKL